jgi:hypothetical protein
MATRKQTYGQYETPAAVADMILGFCLRTTEDRLLDPSCGRGAFLSRADQYLRWLEPERMPANRLWGVELDIDLAAQAQVDLPHAHIISRDFFEMEPWPESEFDAIIGNPPYTRSEWIDNILVQNEQPHQLSMFDQDSGEGSDWTSQGSLRASQVRGEERLAILGRRAGLHAFFFVHGVDFLKEAGRFGFVVPNSWLDVAYGERLKRFILEHYKILAIIESKVERWFSQARINTCLIILEKTVNAEKRLSNVVQLVRLEQSLAELVPFSLDDPKRFSQMQQLTTAILAEGNEGTGYSKREIIQQDLVPGDKWGVALRAPVVYQKRVTQTQLQPLRNWTTIHRGFTTGVNNFFYVDRNRLEEWPIEQKFRQPLLKSLRTIQNRLVSAKDCNHQVLLIKPDDDISETVVREYIKWGEEQGWNRRLTCALRQPWYSLTVHERAPILLQKGIWGRHFAAVVEEGLFVDQQIYQVTVATGITPIVASALLNSAWFALQLELRGRINFGEGVLWLAQYELEEILLPDPRYLPDRHLDNLTSSMKRLLGQDIGSLKQDSNLEAWRELNETVFDIMDFSKRDREAVVESILERVDSRQNNARTVACG